MTRSRCGHCKVLGNFVDGGWTELLVRERGEIAIAWDNLPSAPPVALDKSPPTGLSAPRLKQQQGEYEEDEFDEEYPAASSEEGGLSADEEQRIKQLFEQARKDRSKAYELKRELDRLEVFAEYEDRFLDLFRKPG